MELYDFNILSLNEQMEVVNQLGTFIDNRIEIKEHCNLYAIGMFYVEVVYDPLKNKITETRSFKTGYLLDKYSNLKI
jgi:hypothetical protein